MTSTNVLEELQRFAAQRAGRLVPSEVLDSAREEGSPLHSHFEWDDSVAGEAYRLIQARDLIRKVEVTIVSDDKPRRVRAFVHIAPAGEGSEQPTDGYYMGIEDVAASSAARESFLARLDAEWRSFRRRWRDYDEALSELIRRDMGDVA